VPDELLTVAEVASLLKLNQQTVRNMIDRGELRAVRVGQRRVRIRQSVLDAFLAAGETQPQAPPRLDRDELAARLDRARNALAVADDAELTAALHTLAELLEGTLADRSADLPANQHAQ
jgi:excisionase family DNA binding protein